MERGVDTSYANGAIDWAAAKADGLSFAYMRACYGSNPYDDDPNFESNHDAAKAAGLLVGAYFFWLAAEDPFQQVHHFLARIAGREGDLRPCIDVEEGSFPVGSHSPAAVNIQQLAAVSGTLQKAFNGLLPVIYTNSDTWETYFAKTNAFSGHPLWIANPSNPAGAPDLVPGWATWAIHQYSQSGTLAGANGTIDLDCAPDFGPIKREV